MIRKTFKVGDTITIHRTSSAGTGYIYALARLSGGVALVDETVAEAEDKFGGLVVKAFTFQFLKPGPVEIQFVYYHTPEEVIYEDVFPYIVMNPEAADTPLYGGWGEYEPVTDEEKELFHKCVTLKGVKYTPMVVAQQLVAGRNYRFFCMTKSVTRKPNFGFARVEIYASLTGELKLENIVEY